MKEAYKIISMQIGEPKAVIRHGEEQWTSFLKTPTKQTVFLTSQGLVGDGQAVTKHHGGAEKAVCVYPFKHYAYWEKQVGKEMHIPAFGENVTVDTLDEETVFIGDVFQWGEAIVQVNQPRKPCARISFVHNVKDLMKQVVQSGFTGYYMRVLQEGHVSMHDTMKRIRSNKSISVAEINRLLYKNRKDKAALKQAIKTEGLAEDLRNSLASFA
ncbi:MOSC domain-containing protein [Pontibacillus litoralis]|uniref:MOSC domain-containing protein n=1 Tax=Pontibacillus litoralis JSM 072002 TaxID=1385512 RepID=A0A0A5G4X9_9BACI|nr:MOSC domain-containing protein [Pontibacillus litoralis]KGX88176.1 hypothetical protein N784_10600 [Pontibacillus litoralis JSM 072002]